LRCGANEGWSREARSGQVPKPAVKSGAWRVFLLSRYNVLWALRVSRYNVDRKQVTSQGILSFKGTLARSRYKVVGPDIRSRIRAKTVTSKLTLPSVLVVSNF
jgi:hypothetical protein